MSEEQGTFFQRDTLADARRFVQINMDKGCVCPCCERPVKRYRRKILYGQARQLIELYRLGKNSGWDHYFHRRGIIDATPGCYNNDLAFLRHWSLLEPKPNKDSTKKDSGSFRITMNGRAFVLNQTIVPKYLIQYNDAIEGFVAEPMVSIVDALGTHFNYLELMQGL